MSSCWFTFALTPPLKNKNMKFFWGTTMEIKPHSFFVLSCHRTSYLCIYIQFFYCRFIWKSYVYFSFIEFIFVMVKDTYLLILVWVLWRSSKGIPEDVLDQHPRNVLMTMMVLMCFLGKWRRSFSSLASRQRGPSRNATSRGRPLKFPTSQRPEHPAPPGDLQGTLRGPTKKKTI